jgi:hypothetical protein
MRAKDRSSFGPQSIHRGFMTGIGKYRRGASANLSGLVPYPKTARWFSPVMRLRAFQLIVYYPFRRGSLTRPSRKNYSKPGMRERIVPPGAGGTGKCTVENNWNQQRRKTRAGLGRKRRQPTVTEKTDSRFGNFYFPAADHSAVLRDWSCDSNVAQYSRSEASSA